MSNNLRPHNLPREATIRTDFQFLWVFLAASAHSEPLPHPLPQNFSPGRDFTRLVCILDARGRCDVSTVVLRSRFSVARESHEMILYDVTERHQLEGIIQRAPAVPHFQCFPIFSFGFFYFCPYHLFAFFHERIPASVCITKKWTSRYHETCNGTSFSPLHDGPAKCLRVVEENDRSAR